MFFMQFDTEILKLNSEQKNFYIMGIKFPFEGINVECPKIRPEKGSNKKTTDRYNIADVGHTSPACNTGSTWERRG